MSDSVEWENQHSKLLFSDLQVSLVAHTHFPSCLKIALLVILIGSYIFSEFEMYHSVLSWL